MKFVFRTVVSLLLITVVASIMLRTGFIISVERGQTRLYTTLFYGSTGVRIERDDLNLPFSVHTGLISKQEISFGEVERDKPVSLLGITEYKMYSSVTQIGNSKPWVDHSNWSRIVVINPITAYVVLGVLWFWSFRKSKSKPTHSTPTTGFPVTV